MRIVGIGRGRGGKEGGERSLAPENNLTGGKKKTEMEKEKKSKRNKQINQISTHNTLTHTHTRTHTYTHTMIIIYFRSVTMMTCRIPSPF